MSVEDADLRTRPTAQDQARRPTGRLKIWLSITGIVVVGGLIAAFVLTRPTYSVVRVDTYDVSAATTVQLEQVADHRTFFGHQSVGANLLDALPAVYSAAGLPAPEVIESDQPQAAGDTGYVQHAYVGENGDPLGKIADFDRIIRGGVGDQVDVAALKLCYVDFHDGDDIAGVFAAYRDTLAALERDYPDVTFVYLTVPLTTEQSLKNRVKDRLGMRAPYGPEHNIAREQFNALIRAEYSGTGRLFDIAAVQSTAYDGTREVHSFEGSDYYAMVDELAKDPGHLNSEASARAASAFLASVAGASSADGR